MVTLSFDIDAVLAGIRAAVVGTVAEAAMFELRDGSGGVPGYGTLFQQLVACIISIRTRDETRLPVARRRLARAATPAAVAALRVEGIGALIAESTFAEAKAAQIHAIALRTAARLGGELPADPEGTMAQLEAILPRRHWVEINRLLVPFGKHVCTGARPKCSSCPVLAYCRQVGVGGETMKREMGNGKWEMGNGSRRPFPIPHFPFPTLEADHRTGDHHTDGFVSRA